MRSGPFELVRASEVRLALAGAKLKLNSGRVRGPSERRTKVLLARKFMTHLRKPTGGRRVIQRRANQWRVFHQCQSAGHRNRPELVRARYANGQCVCSLGRTLSASRLLVGWLEPASSVGVRLASEFNHFQPSRARARARKPTQMQTRPTPAPIVGRPLLRPLAGGTESNFVALAFVCLASHASGRLQLAPRSTAAGHREI